MCSAKASWSPDGGKLVLGMIPWDSGLQVIDSKTNEIQNILDFGKDPAWSPGEGRWIAFATNHDSPEREEVWIVEPSGKNPRRIVEGGYPSWSLDGKALFVHSRQQKKILAIQPGEKATSVGKVCDMPAMYPAISPEGACICYTDNDTLHILDRETGKETYSISLPAKGEAFYNWSPDGKRIGIGIMGADETDPANGIWIFDLESRIYKKVASGPFTMPVWSPDGSKIAIDRRSSQGMEVWVIETQNLEKKE